MRADLLYLQYHKDTERWTIGPSYVPYGRFEAKEDAQSVLDDLLKEEARASRIRASIREENQDERARHQSGCTGVTWNVNVRKWQACICIDGRSKVKYFDNLSTAVHCRRKMVAARKQHNAYKAKRKAKEKAKAAKDKALAKQQKHEISVKKSTLLHDILAERKKY